MITTVKRMIRAGFIGFWRNAFVSFSAIFVMVVTLFVVGSAIFFGELLDTSLEQIQQKVDINVYFVTTAPEDDILALKSSLEGLPEVAEVTYTSREAALEAFRARYENDELTIQALDELGDNPLGASLSIRATETSQYEGIAAFLEAQREAESTDNVLIDRINFFQNKAAIDKLTSILGAVEQTAFMTTILLVVASVLITFNTIRLTIYTSREEISVMRLVGAGNTYIRGPFMLQGVMYGLAAGVVTLILFYPVTLWLGPATESFFLLNIFNFYVSNFAYFFVVIVGGGMVLGAISSMLAIARYLHV